MKKRQMINKMNPLNHFIKREKLRPFRDIIGKNKDLSDSPIVTLWHGTTKENAAKIMKEGLQPKRQINKLKLSEDPRLDAGKARVTYGYHPITYLTGSSKTAASQAEIGPERDLWKNRAKGIYPGRDTKNPVVLKVTIPKDQIVQPDVESGRILGTYAFTTNTPIPPQNIKIVDKEKARKKGIRRIMYRNNPVTEMPPIIDWTSQNALYQPSTDMYGEKSDRDFVSPVTGSRIKISKGRGISLKHFPSVDDISYFYDTSPQGYSPTLIHLTRKPWGVGPRGGATYQRGGDILSIFQQTNPRSYRADRKLIMHETGHKIDEDYNLIEDYKSSGLKPENSPSTYVKGYLKKRELTPEQRQKKAIQEDIAEGFTSWHKGVGSPHIYGGVSERHRLRWARFDDTTPSATIEHLPIAEKGTIQTITQPYIDDKQEKIQRQQRREQFEKSMKERMTFFNNTLGKEFKYDRWTPRAEYEEMEAPETFVEDAEDEEARGFTTKKTPTEYAQDYTKIKEKGLLGKPYHLKEANIGQSTDIEPYTDNTSEDKTFEDPLLPRFPNNPRYKIKWYPVDEILAKHAANDPGNIMNDRNLMGNRLANAKKFIEQRKYMTEDWPGGGIGGFEPTLINTKGRIMDGRHRLRALKELGYDPVPVEEYDSEAPDQDNTSKSKAIQNKWYNPQSGERKKIRGRQAPKDTRTDAEIDIDRMNELFRDNTSGNMAIRFGNKPKGMDTKAWEEYKGHLDTITHKDFTQGLIVGIDSTKKMNTIIDEDKELKALNKVNFIWKGSDTPNYPIEGRRTFPTTKPIELTWQQKYNLEARNALKGQGYDDDEITHFLGEKSRVNQNFADLAYKQPGIQNIFSETKLPKGTPDINPEDLNELRKRYAEVDAKSKRINIATVTKITPIKDTTSEDLALSDANKVSLFHGTTKENAERILKEGFNPEIGSRKLKREYDKVFLTPIKNVALLHANVGPEYTLKGKQVHEIDNQHPEDAAILKVTIPKSILLDKNNRVVTAREHKQLYTLLTKPDSYGAGKSFKEHIYEVRLDPQDIPLESIKLEDIRKFKQRAYSESVHPEEVGVEYHGSVFRNPEEKGIHRIDRTPITTDKQEVLMTLIDSPITDDTSKDSQIYLTTKNVNKKYNLDWGKTPVDQVAMFVLPPYPNRIYMGKGMKDIDVNKRASIKAVASTLGHEELHNVLQKEIGGEASHKLDNITAPQEHYIDTNKVLGSGSSIQINYPSEHRRKQWLLSFVSDPKMRDKILKTSYDTPPGEIMPIQDNTAENRRR